MSAKKPQKPVVYELSPRQEALVAALGASLDASPDDALMELFSQPPPKSTLPIRWDKE